MIIWMKLTGLIICVAIIFAFVFIPYPRPWWFIIAAIPSYIVVLLFLRWLDGTSRQDQ